MATTISQTTTMAEPNYILRIEVKYDPVVWRTLSVPTTITFEKLHFAIQIAFGWANAHLYQFLVLDAPPNANARRSRMPQTLLTIQGHGNDMDFGPRPKRSQRSKLRDVFEDERYRNKRVKYEYDFGDPWEHSVALIGRGETTSDAIICLEGEGGPIEEDYGGSDEDECEGSEDGGLEEASQPVDWSKDDVNELLAGIDAEMRMYARESDF